MLMRHYQWYINHLTEHVSMKQSDVVFVENIASWCREHGVPENDEHRPIKLVSGNGSGVQMLIAEEIPDDVVEQRIKAIRIRSQLKNVAYDRTELLNSETKKIAYLFLKEYSSSFPELVYDELAADEWVFEQMDRIGMLRP